MKRTTVRLPDDLASRLRQEAQRRDVTVSELTRDALESYLGKRRLGFEAAGRSGRHDIATRIDEILREEWGAPSLRSPDGRA